mmetsp:Transcript_33098/g.65211  ORF Transcript_33098/g.65211 Transcript_33098/m.65211 type:complete len:219 (-) Transcript_33098:592-1248(-)
MTRGSCSCQETTCLLGSYSSPETACLLMSLAASPGCIAQTSARQRSGHQAASPLAAAPQTSTPPVCAADACNTRISGSLHAFLPGYTCGHHRVEWSPEWMPGQYPPQAMPAASAAIPSLSALQACRSVAATDADDLPGWQHGLPPRGLRGVPLPPGPGPGGFVAPPPAPGVQFHNKLQLLQSLQFPSSTVSHHRELHRFAGQGVHKPLLFPPPCSRAG